MTYSLYFPNPCSSAWSLVLFTVSMVRVSFALSCLQYLTWYSKTIPLLWSKGISCQLTLTLVELVLYAVTFDGGWSGAEDVKVKIDEYANQLCMEVISIKHERQCFLRISNTEKRVELGIRPAEEQFWRTSRCLDSPWNTALSVWYIFSIETKTKE